MSNLRELGFEVSPSFFSSNMFVFSFNWKQSFKPYKPSSWIRVKNGQICPTKERPTLKPRSLRLDTCQGQISFNLAYWTPFCNRHFVNVCDLHMKCMLLWLQYDMVGCMDTIPMRGDLWTNNALETTKGTNTWVCCSSNNWWCHHLYSSKIRT